MEAKKVVPSEKSAPGPLSDLEMEEAAKLVQKDWHLPSTLPLDVLEGWIDMGIPVSESKFNANVTTQMGGVPEGGFTVKSEKVTRKAEQWYTPHGLIVKQKGKYLIVPLDNVIFAHLII